MTVCYNAAETIQQTLQSVAVQTASGVEHIVVDGGSTDGTVEILKNFQNPRLHWISEPDNGIYSAMNKGWKMASGEIVAFLNADDTYFPNTAELVLDAFSDETDIIYGNLRKERFLCNRWFHRYEKPNLDLMPRTMGIFHPATFVRRSLFESIGPYDEQYRFSADYDWLLRAYLAECRFRYLDQPLAIFRVGGVSTLDCGSYAEGLDILRRHKTGYADDMEKLLKECRKKVPRLRTIHNLALWTGTTKLLEKRMTKKWIPNNGGFGA